MAEFVREGSALADELQIFLVDDDESLLESVTSLGVIHGVAVRTFASAEALLHFCGSHQPAGCLVAEIMLEGMGGVELQEELRRRSLSLPMVLVTSRRETPLAVRAMRNGAIDVLDKPCDVDHLWQAIREGLRLAEEQRTKSQRVRTLRQRFDSLTPSEQQVLALMLEGTSNKVIANRLGVSIRTVENRRRQVFHKIGAQSVAELVRLALELDTHQSLGRGS